MLLIILETINASNKVALASMWLNIYPHIFISLEEKKWVGLEL